MKATPLAHANPSSQSALRTAEPAPAWRQGRVIACGESNWLVHDGEGTRRMRRALSCLLMPEVGDTVACLAAQEPASGWIVAVLERAPLREGEAPAPQRLRVDGDLVLEVNGRWHAQAQALHVKAETLAVEAGTVKTRFDALRSVGRLMEATVSCTRWVGQELTAVVDRWSQHSQSSQRHVEGMDRAQAGHMELRAEGVMHTHAAHVLTEGEALVKTRGSQIHFGG